MQHFQPHPSSKFEGYYSKFDLPSGAHLALIICTIPNATQRPHMVSFTYVPKDGRTYFQREIWAKEIKMTNFAPNGPGFELIVPGLGRMWVNRDSTTEYYFENKDFHFSGKTNGRQAWSSYEETPESVLVKLPLPLHWHVHTLGSECRFNLSIPSFNLLSSDKAGSALVHQEKNWANSFPSAHIWVQARDSPPLTSAHRAQQQVLEDPGLVKYHSLCIAGGQILGTEAYLLGYRSTTHPSARYYDGMYELDFRPPFAMRLFGYSPSLDIKPDFDKRKFTLTARNWMTRIDVEAQAPEDTFFPLSSPFPEGHRENFLTQSFNAEIVVRVYRWVWGLRSWDPRGWWTGFKDEGMPGCGKWVLEERVALEGGSLEFGGGYYKFAGSESRKGR